MIKHFACNIMLILPYMSFFISGKQSCMFGNQFMILGCQKATVYTFELVALGHACCGGVNPWLSALILKCKDHVGK